MSGGSTGRGRRPGRGRKAGRGSNPVSRTSELARKRERRSFRLRLLGFTGLILVLLLAGVYHFWLRDSSFVSIKNLEVVGVSTKTEEGRQIDQAVRTAMGVMTTLNLKPEVLEEELARFPRVAGSKIETSLPDSAKVTVEIRRDGSIFGKGSDALLIATDGTVLGPADGLETTLPLITDGDPPSDGSLTGRALSQAVLLGATPPELRSHVKDSVMTPEGVEVRFDNDLVMLFGDSSHADQKWRAAAALIADPEFDISSYVDLSVPRRPAVTASPESDPVEEEAPIDGSGEPFSG